MGILSFIGKGFKSGARQAFVDVNSKTSAERAIRTRDLKYDELMELIDEAGCSNTQLIQTCMKFFLLSPAEWQLERLLQKVDDVRPAVLRELHETLTR